MRLYNAWTKGIVFLIGLVALQCGSSGQRNINQSVDDRQTPAEPQQIGTDSDEAPAEEKQDGPLTWIRDDFAGARTRALSRGVPIVVDVWAVWCRPCLLMQRFVLSDASLAVERDRFVWLSLDADKLDENAEIIKQLELNTLPAYSILEPSQGGVLLTHEGVMSLEQFRVFLDKGEREYRDGGEFSRSQ